METVKDLWAALRLSMLDRMGNPLAGSFCISWVIWNFRLLMVAVGSGEWKPKIEYIDKVLMPSWTDWLVHGYFIPLVVALAWVFVFPSIFRMVMVFHREQLAKTAAAVMLADGKQPIGVEEANRLRLRVRGLSDEWERERAAYLKQNEELSEQIATLQKSTAPAVVASQSSSKVEESSAQEGDPPARSGPDSDVPDPLVEEVATYATDGKGNSIWPLPFAERDLAQLPSSLASRIRGERFEMVEVQALLLIRNWKRIDHGKLARALGIEEFDAQVVLDRLRSLSLVSTGTEGNYLNADGRMLTSYFKRLFSGLPQRKREAKTGNE